MLFDIDHNEKTEIPRRSFYDRWRPELRDEDHQAIMDALHKMMDKAVEQGNSRGNGGIFNSSYVPGAEWAKTPYLPIWEACGRNEETAKLFYGLLVWEAVMSHDAEWYYHRQESTRDKPIGLTYFQQR